MSPIKVSGYLVGIRRRQGFGGVAAGTDIRRARLRAEVPSELCDFCGTQYRRFTCHRYRDHQPQAEHLTR